MSKDNTRSALVPKAYAAFSDAIEEASVVIARKAVEIASDVMEREAAPRRVGFTHVLDTAPVYARIAEIAEQEFKNSMLERFAIVEPDGE